MEQAPPIQRSHPLAMASRVPTPPYAESWHRYRDFELGRCRVCGLLYDKESDDDRRTHAVRHRRVLEVYRPKPDEKLTGLYGQHGQFVPINSTSPRSLRTKLDGIALMFQRELGFDFAPYAADEGGSLLDQPPLSHHWLIVAPDGRAIGGLSARWREFSNVPSRWVWAWVWVIPSERGKGHTARCWAMLQAQLPGIEPEDPFSLPVAKFFAERSDVSERTRKLAAHRVAGECDDLGSRAE